MKVYLIGVGLGNSDTLTAAARQAIEECPVLIGAPRLLKEYEGGGKTCLPLIAAADIEGAVHKQENGPVAVLLSGDVGFYSGAKNLYPLLEDCDLTVLPGVSSMVYFCAALRTPWQDVFPVSAHGRVHNAPGEIQCHGRTFVLTGGGYRAGDLCRELTEWGMGEVRVTVGERLSYPTETITAGTAAELAGKEFDSLAVVLAENPSPVCRSYNSPGIPDEEFLRGEAPMTKEEVRTLAVSKLRLQNHHTVWDVGAGTGSVSVECALTVPAGRVFAVERKSEAVKLLEANRDKFGVSNLHVIPGLAPEALKDLPAPDRVFLGGTAGNLEQILTVILAKNPVVRIVLTAVTVETLGHAAELWKKFGFHHAGMMQLAVTRTRKVGPYHLMDAQNPVWMLWGEGAV